MFIFDAHLDLSMNAMEWNRDLRNNVSLLRQLEQGMDDKPDRGRATVSFPDLRKGNIGIVVATQIARFVKPDSLIPGWNSPQQACRRKHRSLGISVWKKKVRWFPLHGNLYNGILPYGMMGPNDKTNWLYTEFGRSGFYS